ncbi:MAG: NERD domain-containing protein, partial [Methanobrevibacter sp.]|nr:NERD domain-containing protein [Methanobrevibacter sp.]
NNNNNNSNSKNGESEISENNIKFYSSENNDLNGQTNINSDFNRLNKDFNESKISHRSYHDVFIVLGLVISLVGFSDIILTLRYYSILFFALGIVIFIYGIYLNRKLDKFVFRGNVIRTDLLTLPDDFHILYHVKIPDIDFVINHVVIGPTGIYAILTENYSKKSKNKKNSNLNEEDITTLQTKFKTDKKGKIKFDNNAKLKLKSIKMADILLEFLKSQGVLVRHVEPIVAFVNQDIIIFNIPLNDEDLFNSEMLNKIAYGEIKLGKKTIQQSAIILSQISADCTT